MNDLTENKQKLKYQLMKNQLQEKQLEKQNKIIEDKYSSWYSFFLNILFHCISVSIIPLVCFSVILFKSNKMSDISNITIFALSIIYILFSLLSMYLHPYRYTSLLSPYRVTRVSLLTPSLLLLMSVPCSVIICVGGWWVWVGVGVLRSEEHTSELQSQG